MQILKFKILLCIQNLLLIILLLKAKLLQYKKGIDVEILLLKIMAL